PIGVVPGSSTTTLRFATARSSRFFAGRIASPVVNPWELADLVTATKSSGVRKDSELLNSDGIATSRVAWAAGALVAASGIIGTLAFGGSDYTDIQTDNWL